MYIEGGVPGQWEIGIYTPFWPVLPCLGAIVSLPIPPFTAPFALNLHNSIITMLNCGGKADHITT